MTVGLPPVFITPVVKAAPVESIHWVPAGTPEVAVLGKVTVAPASVQSNCVIGPATPVPVNGKGHATPYSVPARENPVLSGNVVTVPACVIVYVFWY